MGRNCYSRRGVIEETGRISIDDLIKAGLKPNAEIWRTFNILFNGTVIGMVSYRVETKDEYGEINFKYTYGTTEGNVTREYRHTIKIDRPHFGGYRYYFLCGYCSGTGKCKTLYFNAGRVACRSCLNLVYASSRYHRHSSEYAYAMNRAESKAERYREHGHPRKANRLLWRAYYYGEKDMEHLAHLISEHKGMAGR